MIKLIEDKINEIVAICKTHHVISIALFGSAAKGLMNENSDIDFLVQFSDDIDVLDYADNYFSILEKLVSRKSIKNPILKEEIDRSKVELYAA
jgi:predicted nucleotidyltransferase